MEEILTALSRVKPKIKLRLTKELLTATGSTPFIWQVLFFYLPLIFLFTLSFVEYTESNSFVGVTSKHFLPIFNAAYFSVIGNSLILSFTTALFCLLIGFPLAYFIALHAGKYKNLFLSLLIIPFWTNFILHIYAWCFVLEKQGFLNNILIGFGLINEPLHFLNSYFSVLLMMVYFYLPFMVLPIYSSLERFDKSLLEASLDLGANKRQTLVKVLIPLTMNAIRAGVFLVYIPSFGEFVIPELMGGDRDFFVGNVISLFVLGEKTAPVGIAFTVLSVSLLFISLYFLNKGINSLSKWLSGGLK